MPVKLIINADDFGVSKDINKGIIECYKKGVVTDVSLLACGDAFSDALRLASENNIKAVGIHISVTGGFTPVNKPGDISTLVGENCKFPDEFTSFVIDSIRGKINEAELYREITAQIKKVKAENLTISHLDSHQHIHTLPRVLNVVIKAMKDEGIRALRFPYENVRPLDLLKEPFNTVRHFCLGAASRASINILKSSGLVYNNAFFGQFHAHKLGEKDFYGFISSLAGKKADIVAEIGCHPGFFGEDISKARPWYKYCEEEVKVICDPGFRQRIHAAGVKLVRWEDI